MYKLKHTTILCLLTLSVACLAAGCGKKREKIDLSDVQETAAETMEDTSAAETESTTAAPETTQITVSGSAANISAQINTYTSGKVSIQYPSILNMDDSEQAAAIDALLKENALAILDAWNIKDSEDAVEITCKVLSADRSRITAVYTGTATAKGAAYPVNLFYSSTVNVRTGENMGFTDFADPAAMAAYVRSDDCVFPQAEEEVRAELIKAKNEITMEQYTKLFQNADFPLKTSNSLTGAFTFPGTFSYEHEGTIFFSIPVAHALGDYAIVAYTPETK